MDDVRAYNQILMCLHGIGWMTAQIEQVREQLHMTPVLAHAQTRHEATGFPTAKTMAQDKEAFLQETAGKLSDVLEDVGNYLNGHDLAQPMDVEITEPLFRWLNGKEPV